MRPPRWPSCPALWLLHALVDYPWDFVAVTGPALFAVGVLAAAGREPVRVANRFAAARRRSRLALAAVGVGRVAVARGP